MSDSTQQEGEPELAHGAPEEASEDTMETGQSMIAQRLGEARVELRTDLDVSRHLFRGAVSYVLQDPLTSQSHKLGVGDYYILSNLSVDTTLDETFRRLVTEGRLDLADEERFYQFIFQMHRQALLKLPIADETTLYKRRMSKLEDRRKGRLSSILFCRVPIWNPDAFLARTLNWVRPLCSRPAAIAWCVLVATAIWVMARQWDEFQRPFADIFSGGNLPLLWITLIALKIAHEFGHAYSCRYYGGHVPEMGIFFVLFTPCAFVDTSSAWAFTKKSQRIMVCMAGMYVELAIAAVAVLAWSVMEPGLARSAVHNVVLLASVVTIGFNTNPLMRYDGYYALSDLVEIPNLRSRSQEYAKAVLKRFTLGIPISSHPAASQWGSPTMRAWLLVFGIAGALYKIVLVIGISTAIAMKMLLGGLLVGGAYFANELVKLVRNTIPYLWFGQESAPVRVRAIGLSLVLIAGLPLGVAAVPVPAWINAPAVLRGGEVEVIRAEASGFLADVYTQPGETIAAGTSVALLEEPEKSVDLAMMRDRLEVARIRQRALASDDLASAEKEAKRIRGFEDEVAYLERDLARLEVATPSGGRVATCLDENAVGRFVRRGDEIATLTNGSPRVRALLTEDDVASSRPAPGMSVEFRSEDDPSHVWRGVIERVSPTGSRRLDDTFLDHLDLTQFELHPVTQEASRSQFEIEVALDPEADHVLRHGARGRVRLTGEAEPIGRWIYRKVLLFADRVGG